MASVIRGDDNFDSATVGSTTLADVGTYAFCKTGSNIGVISAGSTTSGSNLLYSDRNGNTSGSPSVGTWRIMGHGQNTIFENVWLRIS